MPADPRSTAARPVRRSVAGNGFSIQLTTLDTRSTAAVNSSRALPRESGGAGLAAIPARSARPSSARRFIGPAAASARASTNATTSSIFLVGRSGSGSGWIVRADAACPIVCGGRRRIVGRPRCVGPRRLSPDLGLFLNNLRHRLSEPPASVSVGSSCPVGPGFFRLGGRISASAPPPGPRVVSGLLESAGVPTCRYWSGHSPAFGIPSFRGVASRRRLSVPSVSGVGDSDRVEAVGYGRRGIPVSVCARGVDRGRR